MRGYRYAVVAPNDDWSGGQVLELAQTEAAAIDKAAFQYGGMTERWEGDLSGCWICFCRPARQSACFSDLKILSKRALGRGADLYGLKKQAP